MRRFLLSSIQIELIRFGVNLSNYEQRHVRCTVGGRNTTPHLGRERNGVV